MVVKKVFKVKDEILNDEFELFGQTGCLSSDDNSLMLLDFSQMGQYVLENVCDEEIVSEEKIKEMCIRWSKFISKKIINNIYENALSDAIDDEEIKVIL